MKTLGRPLSQMHKLLAVCALVSGALAVRVVPARRQETSLRTAAGLFGPTCPVCGKVESVGNLADGLNEASGMTASARHSGVVYLVNDSPEAPGPALFATGIDGSLRGIVNISGLNFTLNKFGSTGFGDIEALSAGPCEKGQNLTCIFVGDIGNNCARPSNKCKWQRKDHLYNIIRIQEPERFVADGAKVTAQRLWFRYPNNAIYDAETMMIGPQGQVYILTKNDSGTSDLFVIDGSLQWDGGLKVGQVSNASFVTTLKSPAGSPLFTGGDLAVVDGEVRGITLRTYGAIVHYPVLAGQSIQDALAGEACILGSPVERQGESVAWLPVRAHADDAHEAYVVTTSEGHAAEVHRLRCSWDAQAQSAAWSRSAVLVVVWALVLS